MIFVNARLDKSRTSSYKSIKQWSLPRYRKNIYHFIALFECLHYSCLQSSDTFPVLPLFSKLLLGWSTLLNLYKLISLLINPKSLCMQRFGVFLNFKYEAYEQTHLWSYWSKQKNPNKENFPIEHREPGFCQSRFFCLHLRYIFEFRTLLLCGEL